MNFDQLYQLSEDKSVFNNPQFIAIIESVYRCKPLHYVKRWNHQDIGIPAFFVQSILSGKKVTSMPFNFYPPLIGNFDENPVFESLIHLTQSIGEKCYLEYKSFGEISPQIIEKYQVITSKPSIVSSIILQNNYKDQEQTFRKKYRSYLRTKLKTAEEMNIKFITAKSILELKEWYTILVRLYRDKHRMITQPFDLFTQLLHPFNSTSLGTLLLAKHDNTILSGIILLKDKKHWEYSWAATRLKFTQLGLNALLVNHSIQLAIENNIRTFGLGSSSPNDDSLRFFKRNWGATEKYINYYYWNHFPKQVDLKTSFKTARKLYSLIPIFILKRMPKYIVPQIA